jgi:hypothetical protein
MRGEGETLAALAKRADLRAALLRAKVAAKVAAKQAERAATGDHTPVTWPAAGGRTTLSCPN